MELRCLLAVSALVLEYDRTKGRVSNAQVAAFIDHRGSDRDIRRALKNLAEAGVYELVPGKRGYAGAPEKAPLYIFPVPGAAPLEPPISSDGERGHVPHSPDQMTGVNDPGVTGVDDASDRGSEHKRTGSGDPTSEVLTDVSFEVVRSLTRTLVKNKPDEATAVADQYVREYGLTITYAALERISERRTVHPYASNLAATLKAELAGTRSLRSKALERPTCSNDCANGWTFDGTEARRCQVCNPAPMAAAR
jgi:hypothetical protein